MSVKFTTNAPLIDLLWRRALSGLDRNIITISGRRVLTVAPGYPGIWLEHEANPFTGVLHPHTTPNYSGSLFVAIEAIQRLHGVHRHDANTLVWNCRLPPGASTSEFILDAPDTGRCRLIQESGRSTLSLNDRQIAVIQGTVRVHTDREGRLTALENTGQTSEGVQLGSATWTLPPRQSVSLT